VGDGIAQLRPRCKSLTVDVSSGIEADAPGGTTLKGIDGTQLCRVALKAAGLEFSLVVFMH
jgi:phosphoribosylanthranilate isomerase